MNDADIRGLRDTTALGAWLWVWCAGMALTLGVLFGSIFPTTTDTWASDAPAFNVGAFWGGVILGLLGAIPVIVLFKLVRRVLLTMHIPYMERPVPPNASTPSAP